MKQLTGYLKRYGKECVCAPLFKMFEASLELFVPLAVKKIIDTGIAGGDRGCIYRMCILMCALAVAGLLASVTAQYFAARAAVGFATDLRQSLYGRIMSFDWAQTDSIGTSTLITRMTDDINIVQNGVNLTLRLLLRSPFVVIGAVIMAFFVDKTAALVFVAAVPVLSVVVFGIMLGTKPLYGEVRKKLDAVVSAARQNINGVRVIRAFGLEEKEIRDFKNRTSLHYYAEKKAGRISAILNPATYVLINTAIIVLIHTGAVRVNTGALTGGAVVALYNYMSQILVELIKLADLIISISKALTSAGRIEEMLGEKEGMKYPERGAEPDFSRPAVEFCGVSLRYGSNAENSLENIDFTVDAGDFCGVIGATGSGKSSLVNLIPRFYDCTSGEVKLFGHSVKDYSRETISGLVAAVPQRAVLFSGSLRDNLKWGNENATDGDIYDALATAQALDVIKNKKDGLDTLVEEGGRNFSGGQRQRLTVARALLKRAPVLILDDSSSALDFATDAHMRKALRELDYKPAVIVISQRTGAVKDCESITVLENGRVSACGSHGELMKTSEIYRETVNAEGMQREKGDGV